MRALLLAIYSLREKEKKDILDTVDKLYGLTFEDYKLDMIANDTPILF